MKHRNRFYNERVRTAELKLVSGDRDSIIKWIYDTHLVEWYTTFLLKYPIDAPFVTDKIQEIYLILCEKSQETWDKLYAQGQYAISAYVTGIIHQQIISVNSNCYKKYNKVNKTEITQDEEFWKTYGEEH